MTRIPHRQRPVTRLRQALLLGLALLLAVSSAHARKDDEDQDRGRSDRREQQYEQRRADDGRYRQPREDRRERAPEMRRYDPRGEPAYSEPRRRSYEPRRYEEAPRRYEEADRPRSRGYADAQPRYAPPGLSMSEAVMEAERRSGGRVLSAEPGSDGGQPYYRIKVLNPNGRVQILYIDGQ